jgi:hypothetical protein
MHNMYSSCKFGFVTEWSCVQPSYGEPKLNGFLNAFIFFGGKGEHLRVSSQGIVNSTI